MADSLEFEVSIPMDPESICKTWLDGRLHGAMTGAPATGSPEVGAEFTAWNGYIRGKNLEIEPGVRVLQSWRTSDFPDNAPESKLEIRFEKQEYATKVRLIHTEIPEGQGQKYAKGWEKHYFEPMRQYFAVTTRRQR